MWVTTADQSPFLEGDLAEPVLPWVRGLFVFKVLIAWSQQRPWVLVFREVSSSGLGLASRAFLCA